MWFATTWLNWKIPCWVKQAQRRKTSTRSHLFVVYKIIVLGNVKSMFLGHQWPQSLGRKRTEKKKKPRSNIRKNKVMEEVWALVMRMLKSDIGIHTKHRLKINIENMSSKLKPKICVQKLMLVMLREIIWGARDQNWDRYL